MFGDESPELILSFQELFIEFSPPVEQRYSYRSTWHYTVTTIVFNNSSTSSANAKKPFTQMRATAGESLSISAFGYTLNIIQSFTAMAMG